MAPRHIAMVGTASSRQGAPVENLETEIWGVSSRGNLARADRWFEIHRIDGTFSKEGEAATWRAEIKKFCADIPALYMLYPEPDLAANVVTYPFDKITARFGTYLMTSTFAWMMALAIDEMAPIDPDGTRHFAEPGSVISIYGVDMEYGTEWSEQRQAFRAFMKIAEQLGIEVRRVVSGGLVYEPVPYPMWQDDPLLNKIELRNRDAREKLAMFDDSIRMTHTMIAQNKAVLDHISQSHQENYDEAQRVKELERELDGLLTTSSQISRDIVHWQAVNEEQQWMKSFLKP